MITDLGIWTIVINMIAIAFAVQYSRSETFGEALLWLVWDFTGLRFVIGKVFPFQRGNPNPPVTITLWVIGIYTALFGIASNRYENSVDKIENRMNAFITQLAVVTNPEVRREAFGEVSEIQQMRCPIQPILLKPSTIFLSLVKDDRYDEAVAVLTRTVEQNRDDLKGAWLNGANLKGVWLVGAHLESANLSGANLRGARLGGANLHGAHLVHVNLEDARLANANLERTKLFHANLHRAFLSGASLQGALLWNANLHGARLWNANLQDTNFSGADLEDAILIDAKLERASLEKAKYLTTDQLCSTRTLYQATMDSELENQVQQQCPEKLEEPK